MSGQFWLWLIGGAALIAAEMMVPGAFLIWPGIAAFLTGMVAYMAPDLGWQIHAVLFAVLTIIVVLAGRRVYGRMLRGNDAADGLNRRADDLIGSRHTLETPILDGFGRLRIGDGFWKIAGPDLPIGTKIRITGTDGIVLTVTPD